MKRISLGIAILSAWSLTAFANTEIQQNKISFIHPQDPSSSAADLFLVERHSVTINQPSSIKDQSLLTHWFTPAGKNGNSKTVFWIKSGRHKSHGVFNDIKQWGYNTVGMPTEMNFAVEGKLRFTLFNDHTYLCKKVVLAQTSKGLNEIWYVFSLYGSGKYQGLRYSNVICNNTSSGLIREFRIVSESHHSFSIIPQSPEYAAPRQGLVR